jgi:hypothetical protein
MKIIIIITSVFFVFVTLLQLYTAMSIAKSETQTYRVVHTEKDFEIRFYPAVTMATITSPAKTYKELGNPGFRKLAGYIFGGNNKKQKIAMTSPVHMNINDSVSSMSFVMPAEFHKDNLPTPNDGGVVIQTTTDEYVAVLKFGGFASNEKIEKYKGILEAALKNHHVTYFGNFRFLGYNPPFQLFGRRNEIIVAVDWNAR